MTRPVRIGSGAGFQGDRLDPALVLAERGELDYLGMECLGERTVPVAGPVVLGLVLPVRSLGLDHGLGSRGSGVARDAIAEAAARRQGALHDEVAA